MAGAIDSVFDRILWVLEAQGYIDTSSVEQVVQCAQIPASRPMRRSK